jgi:hypothetical protein
MRADDAPAQHWDPLVAGLRSRAHREGVEARRVRVLDVDEKYRRRLVGKRGDELAAQIAVDLQQRDQQREAEAEREHHARGQRTRAVDIGEHEAQQCIAWARDAPRDRHDQQGDEPQCDEHAGRGRDEDRGDLAVIGERDRAGGEDRDRERGQHDVLRAGMAAFGRDGVAIERRHRHVVGAPERPEREGEGGEESVEHREGELGRMQRRLDRQRHDAAERGRDRERQDRADHQADRGTDCGEQHHFDEIDREHVAAGCAERLERRDHVAALVEIVLHGVGHADAADQ